MARKTATFIGQDGRDKGKQYLITEMSAAAAEAWAIRAILALANGGVDLPDGIGDSPSLAAVAEVGIKALAGLRYEAAEPLLADMFACVQAQPDPRIVRPLVDEDIEEVPTRAKLRKAVWDLHTDFLLPASH